MKKYWLIIKNTWSEMMVYRLNFVLWRVRMVIRLFITFFLWSSVYLGNEGLFGYTRAQMLTYVLLVYVVSNFVFATKTESIGREINEGVLSNHLLKPINYFFGLGARDVSDKLLNFGFTVVEFGLFILLFQPPFFMQMQVGLITLTLLALAGSIIVYFCISLLLSFLGFWTTEVWASRFIFFILVEFLAGGFFPVDILPQAIAKLLLYTPFPYMFYFPVKVYLGQLATSDILRGFFVLVVWSGVLIYGVKYIWHKGLKVYSAEGR